MRIIDSRMIMFVFGWPGKQEAVAIILVVSTLGNLLIPLTDANSTRPKSRENFEGPSKALQETSSFKGNGDQNVGLSTVQRQQRVVEPTKELESSESVQQISLEDDFHNADDLDKQIDKRQFFDENLQYLQPSLNQYNPIGAFYSVDDPRLQTPVNPLANGNPPQQHQQPFDDFVIDTPQFQFVQQPQVISKSQYAHPAENHQSFISQQQYRPDVTQIANTGPRNQKNVAQFPVHQQQIHLPMQQTAGMVPSITRGTKPITSTTMRPSNQPEDVSVNSHHYGQQNSWPTSSPPNTPQPNVNHQVANDRPKVKLNTYKSSVEVRPVSVDIGSMLKPGEVVMAKNYSGGGKKTRSNSSKVSVSEIEDILRRLQPLALNDQEKAKAVEKPEHYGFDGEEEEDDSDDVENSGSPMDSSDLTELRDRNKLDRVLPTSHLFGGSVGLVSERRLVHRPKQLPPGPLSATRGNTFRSGDSSPQKSSPSEEMVFLKNLSDLGNQLKEQVPVKNAIAEETENFYDTDTHLDYGTINLANLQRQKPASSSIAGPIAQQAYLNQMQQHHEQPEVEPQQIRLPSQTIPIELLVDQLMSSSRLASFGVQHDNVNGYHDLLSPEESDDEEEEEGEGDGEDDSDDQDNNGTLPVDADESALSFTTIRPTDISYSSVANNSDSWIPLSSITNRTHLSTGSKKHDGQKYNERDKRKRNKKIKKKKKKTTKKKKRKKKREKSIDEDSGLRIGGKRLSRKELIKLIAILNKMARKKEPSKERESSRKLLKFLIHLALENYRRSKLQQTSGSSETKSSELDDSLKQSLRSLLRSPLKKGSNETELQLKPLEQMEPTEPREPFVDKERAEASGPSTKSKRAKSFHEISDDLEQYFDSDFFEDLADKSARKNNTSADANSRSIVLKLPSAKSRRSSRSGYRLPVPIYGQQQLEAADEDDVELDHIRISLPRGRRPHSRDKRLQNPRDQEDDEDLDDQAKSKRHKKKRRRESGRKSEASRHQAIRSRERPATKLRARRKEHRESNDHDDDDEYKEDDDDSDRERQPQESTASQSSDPRREAGRMHRKRRGPERFRPIKDDNQDQQVEPEEEVQEDDGQDEEDSGEGQQDADKSAEDNGSQDSQSGGKRPNLDVKSGEPPKRKRKRSRRKYKLKNGEAAKMVGGRKEIDLDTRDEIPAPIVGGMRSSPKRANDTSTASGNKLVKSHMKARKFKPGLDEKVASARQPSDSRKRGEHLKSQKSKPANKPHSVPKNKPKLSMNLDDEGEPKLTSNPDSDYYNEGTSYSNVCDDDGKCQVMVRSNNPELGKAIETNNEPAIVKQIGKWIETAE